MLTLYHFRFSPFSRRTRLALAHKGLEVELREGRDRPEWIEEARRRVPLRTLPVLVDDAWALADSVAIAHWLDRAYPDRPRLWPTGAEALAALEAASVVDVALNTAADLGTRYHALSSHPAWGAVRAEMVSRAQRALDALADRVAGLDRSTIVPSGWSAADMWLLAAVLWFETMPERAAGGNQTIAQILTLGIQLPGRLSKWADAHRERADVRQL
jgi:glutathione S-transferase